jgi:protein-tyrosine phosphatase
MPLKLISSAGLEAVVDHGVEENLASLLTANGYDARNHKARKLNSQMINAADLILVMEKGHKNRLMMNYPGASGKVMLLSKWCKDIDILDPYRKSTEVYAHVFNQIEKSCNAWCKNLELNTSITVTD